MNLHQCLYLGETLLKEHPSIASELLRKYPVRSEAKVLSESEVREYIRKVEKLFELPGRILTQKTESGRVGKGQVNGYDLSEIRRAAIYDLSQKAIVSDNKLAMYLNMGNHTVVGKAKRKAREYVSNRDGIFLSYYEKVKSIEV